MCGAERRQPSAAEPITKPESSGQRRLNRTIVSSLIRVYRTLRDRQLTSEPLPQILIVSLNENLNKEFMVITAQQLSHSFNSP